MCVALLTSLQRVALVCVVMVPISEPHAQATDGEHSVWPAPHREGNGLLFSESFGGGCRAGETFLSPGPPCLSPIICDNWLAELLVGTYFPARRVGWGS